MKHGILNFDSIEDDPRVVSSLLNFVRPLTSAPTLSIYLNGLMDRKGLTSPDVYHRAWLDRQVFNKLVQYANPKRASKRTLMQIAIGVLATEQEATTLLATCGYTFEPASAEDQAFLFCIKSALYSMYQVYEAQDIIEKRAQCK